MFKIFGARPSKEDVIFYSLSDQWKKDSFNNLIKTDMNMKFKDFPSIFFKQFVFNYKLRPKNPIPIFKQKFSDGKAFQGKWYGHSTIFVKINGLNILIDPMFGENAAPVSPFPIKRFSKNTINII